MESSNRLIFKNTIILYVRTIIQMIIGLYTSRIVLQTLGVDDFGVYNVVGSVTTMLSVLNGAMTNATMRYITFEMGKGNENRLNEVFCISLNIHIIIAFFTLIILDSVGVWFLYNKMTIDPERISAAFWVLQCSIVTCIISIINVPYNACVIAHEKMSAFAFFSLFQSIAILVLVLLLPFYIGDKLIMYSIIIMLVQLIIQALYWLFCRRHFPESFYRFLWNKELTKEMARFAGWTMNGNIAWLAYTEGLNILINIFFGPAVNAARGIAITVQSKIVGLCNNIQAAVRPQITKSFAIGDYERMHYLILIGSKYSYYLLLLFSLPIYVVIHELLRLWLGIVPNHTANFVCIILLCSAVDVLKNPLNAAVHATGNIKKFQLWEANTLLLIIPIAYFFLKIGYSVEWAFISQLIVFIIVQIERVLIVCPQINMGKRVYFKELLLPIISVTFCSAIIPLVLFYVWPIKEGNILQLFSYLLNAVICIVISIYLLGLTASEKTRIKQLVNEKILKNDR